MEAFGLGTFMLIAGISAIIIEHPHLPVRQWIDNPFLRRIPMGLGMGLTAVAIIYSPWGKRSGAHINPAVTLTFFRLGKIKKWDAFFYIGFQFIGGLCGIFLITLFAKEYISNHNVNYVATVPGSEGVIIAFFAELVMSFILMMIILNTANRVSTEKLTGIFAGTLVCLFITVEAPYSGMSINPARSVASAVPGNIWNAFWIYLSAPPLGMLLAAELYKHTRGIKNVFCAKLHHHNQLPCIFNCRYHEMFESAEKNE